MLLNKKRLNPFGNKQNGSIICSKCVLPNEKSLGDLKWWFYMNSQIGHKFVDVCDPIGNESILSQIRSLYENKFVRIRPLKCFPNLNSDVSVDTPMFDSFDEYVSKNQRELLLRMDILNEVILNECYFDYMDKYR